MRASDYNRPVDRLPRAAHRATGAGLSRRGQGLLLTCVVLAHVGIAATVTAYTPPRPVFEAPRVAVTLIAPAAPTPQVTDAPGSPAPMTPTPEPSLTAPPPPLPTPKPPSPPTPPKPHKHAARPAPRPVPQPAPEPEAAPAPSAPAASASAPAPTSLETSSNGPALTPALPASDSAVPEQVVEARYDAAYLDTPKPDYPARSRRMREQGRVLLRVFVTRDGIPGKVELSESSGYPRLDRAAQAGVEKWRFVPARRGEHAIDAWMIVPIVYELEGN